MALYSSTNPYTLELTDDFSQLVIQLPKDKLLARLPNAQMLVARRIDGQNGIGRLVRENIMAFSDHVASDNPMVQSLVQDTLIDLIATGLAAQNGGVAELSSPQQHILLRAKSFIRFNLGNPEPDRDMVAKAVGMSVRRLNAIFFTQDQSIANYIRSQRIAAVAEDLRDPRFGGQSISEIAMKYGFSNLQHFSTLFRAHMDTTPKSYRALQN